MAHSDASHASIEGKTRGVAGRMIFLTNDQEQSMSPLDWKGKTIVQVTKSTKSAETRALDMCADSSVDLARMMCQLYTGKKGMKQLKVTLKTDNLGLKETLQSTRQVEEKPIRIVVEYLKDLLARKNIENIDWLKSEHCHADMMTKKGAPCTDKVMDILSSAINE